jgi:hypothetical protein
MRLWSISPLYLDAKGLVALWREALLARAVLSGKTKGYRRHPQLERFRAAPDPLGFLDAYLLEVAAEAARRGYSFDTDKIGRPHPDARLPLTSGQLDFERRHLRLKLARRSPERLDLLDSGPVEPHSLFFVVPGGVEAWEKGIGRPRNYPGQEGNDVFGG